LPLNEEVILISRFYPIKWRGYFNKQPSLKEEVTLIENIPLNGEVILIANPR